MRVVPAKNGWLWLRKGFALFRLNPPAWLFVVLTYWIGVALLGQVPYAGLAVSTALLPAFSVSFMVICAVLDQGGTLKPALIFSGFRSELPKLIWLGVFYLASIVLVLAVTALVDGGVLLQWTLSGEDPPEEALRNGSVSRALLLASAASAPVLMAFWFAPVLAAWERMGTVQSLFYSFFAGWRNWRAFLVYGMALALFGLAFLVFVAAAAIVTHGQMQSLRLMALIFTLLTLPTMFGSFYACYRDIFPEGRLPAAGPQEPQAGR
jgi:hypothetical protein